MVSKRETPQRRQMASKAGQAPAKLAVCEAAARAPASLRPDLTMHTGFRGPAGRARTPRKRGGCWGKQGGKGWSVLDRFHVEADDIRHRIVDQVFKKVIEVQIALVAYRNRARKTCADV